MLPDIDPNSVLIGGAAAAGIKYVIKASLWLLGKTWDVLCVAGTKLGIATKTEEAIKLMVLQIALPLIDKIVEDKLASINAAEPEKTASPAASPALPART